ncbi:MarR family transcriptional regulator [Rhodobacter aestuarii]|uniref:Transcriptional regulator, MarR family n=1 Tax=Rhodobacter aestuarii TaxID=453582 RepID=A0A1N7LS87_9RHOB|nr:MULTISPECIES: MarR family transcriptional regulator [Rhodobacter]PTV95063.1 MarR family transcriptional regulator [Rhodobacter aestuarii]SIS76717.1 transcriptional regulator, MarR family [Rhodobacter aestuarii]SOC07171.1 MarR family transcriptional regulator [Rhodobacter sp. JA431]
MSDCELPPESLGFLMHDATRLLRRRFEVRAAELGLTSAQWRLLVHLMRGGPQPQARLAELLEIEPISLSRLADRMQEGGWVERQPDPHDRRIRILHATDKTRAVIGQAKEIAETIYADALAGLDPAIVEQLMAALRQIISNLSHTTETDHDR